MNSMYKAGDRTKMYRLNLVAALDGTRVAGGLSNTVRALASMKGTKTYGVLGSGKDGADEREGGKESGTGEHGCIERYRARQ